MAKEKIMEFCKKHKKEIIIGTAATAVGVVCCVLFKKKPANPIDVPEYLKTVMPKSLDLPKPDKSVGVWRDFWIDGGTKLPTAIVCDVPMQYMGDLGVEILDHCAKHGIDQIVFDTPVQMVLEFGEI